MGSAGNKNKIKSKNVNSKKEDIIFYLGKIENMFKMCLERSIKGWPSNSIYLVVTLPLHCASLCYLSKNKSSRKFEKL